MARWPKDTPDALAAFYGKPGTTEVSRQLVTVVPPFRMTYRGKPVSKIRFHRKAAAALEAALNEIWDHYGRDQAKIDAAGVSRYAGAYNPRLIRGSSTRWSNHAYGAAIDINASENGLGTTGNMPEAVVAAFERQGAKWGGRYRGRKDPMHFEFVDNGGRIAPPPKEQPKPVPPPDIEPVVPDHVEDIRPKENYDGDQDRNDPERGMAFDGQRDGRLSGTEHQPGFFKRTWRKVTGWTTGIGGTGLLAWFTDPWVIGILVVALFVAIVGIVWFMGPDRVRQWVRRQVS